MPSTIRYVTRTIRDMGSMIRYVTSAIRYLTVTICYVTSTIRFVTSTIRYIIILGIDSCEYFFNRFDTSNVAYQSGGFDPMPLVAFEVGASTPFEVLTACNRVYDN